MEGSRTVQSVNRPFIARLGTVLSRHPLRSLVLFGLIGQIILTLTGSILIYRAVAVMGQTNERVARATETRIAAGQLIRAITEAQSGERGFLVSGNERFLDAYMGALTAVPKAAAHLRELLADDREQLARVASLEALFAEWRDRVAKGEIAARRDAPLGYAAAGRTALGAAMRLRETVAGYAASQNPDGLRLARDQARGLRDQLGTLLRMTPPALVSDDWSRATTLLETIAGADPQSLPAELLPAAATVEAIVRQHTRAAEAAESQVLTFITQRTSQTYADTILRQYDTMARAEETQLRTEVGQGRAATRLAEGVVVAIPIALVVALLVGFVHATGATRAIDAIITASRGLAEGDLTRRVPGDRGDEIGELGAAFNDMAEQIAVRDRQAALLRQMSEMLEASASVDEAFGVVSRYAHELFPGMPGGVYLTSPSRDLVEMATAWGLNPERPLPPVFEPDDCWALRRGQPQIIDGARSGLACRHAPPPPAASLCLPMTAQGETVGVLHLIALASVPNGGPPAPAPVVPESIVALARAVGDRVALAVANLRLRERLHAQSIRDPLTGVFNRRYLEETLEREVRRAERSHHSLGVIMFDIDRFKGFNDTFGHEAGDEFLRALGALLRDFFRREDVVCRYGGEEFVVVLPDASLEATMQRAQMLGEAVGRLIVRYRGQLLGTATLSLGVAAFPQHGNTGDAVMRAADAALYRAKQNGRARAETAWAAGG